MGEFLYMAASTRKLREFPDHSHRGMWEIVVYERGRGLTESGSQKASFRPGTIACHPPGISHSDKAPRGTYESLCLYFRNLRLNPKKMSVFQDETHRPFFKIAGLLLAEYRLKRSKWKERCDNLAALLLSYLDAWSKDLPRHPSVQKLEWVLAEKIADPDFKVQTAAPVSGLSAFHLARLFRKQTGLSPRQYLLELRLRTASDLLLNTGFSIGRVATLSGFGDEHYFSRFFLKRMHLTPGKYRRKNGKQGLKY